MGGFAGISKYSEMNSDDLPASLKTILNKLINDNIRTSNSFKSVPKGSADHYSYRITVGEQEHQRTIECSQYNIQDNLKLLVSYVEKHKIKKVEVRRPAKVSNSIVSDN
jgi:hypothetical protein